MSWSLIHAKLWFNFKNEISYTSSSNPIDNINYLYLPVFHTKYFLVDIIYYYILFYDSLAMSIHASGKTQIEGWIEGSSAYVGGLFRVRENGKNSLTSPHRLSCFQASSGFRPTWPIRSLSFISYSLAINVAENK